LTPLSHQGYKGLVENQVLLVEDDPAITQGLTYLLESDGFTVRACSNPAQAYQALDEHSFILTILDINLPGGTGYQVCREIRRRGNLPVIFLSAMDAEMNVVMGLELGADDYIIKPFRSRELLSRVHSVLRRHKHGAEGRSIRFGDLEIDTAQAKIHRAGQEILLSALEYKLLLVFAGHPGRVYTRAQLLEALWDEAGGFFNDNTLSVYVKRLREKIERDPQNPELIQTVRGMGYKGG